MLLPATGTKEFVAARSRHSFFFLDRCGTPVNRPHIAAKERVDGLEVPTSSFKLIVRQVAGRYADMKCTGNKRDLVVAQRERAARG